MKFLKNFRYNKAFFLFSFLIITNVFSAKSIANNLPAFHDQLFYNDIAVPWEKPHEILTDKWGNVIIGAENSMYIFDGENWNRIPVEGTPVFQRTKGDSIFVASNKKLWILLNKDNAGYKLFPLHVDTSLIKGTIHSLAVSNGIILFADDNNLHWYDDGVHKILTGCPKGSQCYSVTDKFYVYFQGRGVYQVDEAGIDDYYTFVPENENANGILRIHEEKVLVFYKDPVEIYSLSQGEKEKIFQEWWPYYDKAGLKQVHVSGNKVFIETNQDITVLDDRGNLEILTRPMNDFFSGENIQMTYHSSGTLWILHEMGIRSVKYPSIYKTYSKSNGLEGSILDIEWHGEDLYCATSKGIFVLKDDLSNEFIPQIVNQEILVNGFFRKGGYLFCSTKHGIINCSKKNYFHLSSSEIVQSIHNSMYPDLIFAIVGEKLFIYHSNTSGIKEVEKIDPGVGKIKTISTGHDGKFYVLNQDSRVFMLSISISKGLSSTRVYKEEIILNGIQNPLSILPWESNLLVNSPHGLYQHDLISGRISRLDMIFDNKISDYWMYPMEKIDGSKIFFIGGITESGEKYLMKAGIREKLIVPDLAFPLLSGFANAKAIYYDGSREEAWISHPVNLIKVSLTRKDVLSRQPHVKFVSLRLGDDSLLHFTGINPRISPFLGLKRKMGNFEIVYNTTDLRENEFSAFLKGYESGWSSWDQHKSKKYRNLPPGKYSFRVKAKNSLGIQSDIAKIDFKVPVPLLLRPYFIVLYVLSLILGFYFIFLVHKKKPLPFSAIINKNPEGKDDSDEMAGKFFSTTKSNRDPSRGKPRLLSQRYSLVTVLFSDIQGFTRIAEQMNPEVLVDELDSFFFYFDLVVEKYNIEKIKTIGDAYMAAGGIPDKNRTNPVEVVMAALEIQDYMKRLKNREENIWDLRIGIHTGAVIAGVVGHRKVSYDIWGDTVNTASRMESSSEAGKINISEQTYELVKDFFICEYRGKMPVKYKGEIDMYFVKGIRPELSVNLKNIPNKRFLLQLQMLRFHDLEDVIHEKLENELPHNLFFHDLKHTMEVVTHVELIGRAENISDEEQLILKTAALLHDLGYIDDFENHEQRSTELARDILPAFNYSSAQVNQICKLVLSTKYPFKPGNHLEKMLIDADLSYLGRSDYTSNIIKLYKEFKERGKIKSLNEWKQVQREFLSNHRFFTRSANQLADLSKDEQLHNIEKISDYDKDEINTLY